MPDTPTRPTVAAQIDRLVALGVPALAGMDADGFRALARSLTDSPLPSEVGPSQVGPSAADLSLPIVAIHPDLVAAGALAPLMQRADRSGFVVEDMTDLADFAPIPEVVVPDQPLYLLTDVERGDEMLNWSPDEALPALLARGRSPLTVNEGISWLLQEPARLQPGACFMCIGSRKPAARPTRAKPWDARTPALWISGGTGRDGKQRRGAPKVGWCWAGNRHTWLGFGSVGGRLVGSP